MTDTDPFHYVTDPVTPVESTNPDDHRRGALTHDRITHDHRRDELAVTPVDMQSGVLTEWITIDAADACDLADWR